MKQWNVTFETKCYEKDWRHLLQTPRLETNLRYNRFQFKEAVLYINNVNDPEEVSFYADKLVQSGVLTSYTLVDRYASEALDFFSIDKDSFNGGYYYSISELVAIYLCRTDYLLHFSSDSILAGPLEWVGPALQNMEDDPRIKVANPTWNFSYEYAKQESVEENDGFYLGYGFSDQCYLIRTEDFRARIYNEKHPASQRYPAYGGELFEKRVDSWMRNHQYLRITYKHGSYIHRNFT
ncbi:hypothetical protein [Paenibacillus sp. Soil750]|uniref:hypothetical protein n=1 Tax=Paenibacillus sp. Soil750 TaxID=1736398 RepID=UPI0006F835CE|nr:hypothetical protein [Paenibacillus sp. Soil750]KRE71433.1 hypothetical protein ASL11_10310 [Paenibacillus sp. Soil750]